VQQVAFIISKSELMKSLLGNRETMKDTEVYCTHEGTMLCSSVHSFAAAWKIEHMDEPYINFPSSEGKPLLPFF